MRSNRRFGGVAGAAMAALAAAAVFMVGGCKEQGAAPPVVPAPPAPGETGWRPLFDGTTLAGWKATDFGGQGEVKVQDGRIVLERGQGDLTGITWAGGDLPQENYEIALEAQRVEGTDFFCGLTFPVRGSAATLVCGGWGGQLVGISSFDGMDASENETTKMVDFENGRWYHIRLRVTERMIEAWIDDEALIEAEPGERKVAVRWEVEPSQPLGVAAWRTKAAIRALEMRRLAPEEFKPKTATLAP